MMTMEGYSGLMMLVGVLAAAALGLVLLASLIVVWVAIGRLRRDARPSGGAGSA